MVVFGALGNVVIVVKRQKLILEGKDDSIENLKIT
jgi:hypothetical protein